MTRRGRSGSPFSLFSFQDIITCVSGIIILITLVLALELVQRKQAAPSFQTRAIASQIHEAVEQARQDVEQLDARLAQQTNLAQSLATITVDDLQRDLTNTREQIDSLTTEMAALRKQEAAAAASEEKAQAERFNRKSDETRLRDLEAREKALEEELRRVRQGNHDYYNPRTADGKKVWLAQVEFDRILVAPAGQKTSAAVLSLAGGLFSRSPFSKWLDSRSASSDFIFVLIRSDAVAAGSAVRNELQQRRFGFGFDLVGPQQSAVDAEIGAAGP